MVNKVNNFFLYSIHMDRSQAHCQTYQGFLQCSLRIVVLPNMQAKLASNSAITVALVTHSNLMESIFKSEGTMPGVSSTSVLNNQVWLTSWMNKSAPYLMLSCSGIQTHVPPPTMLEKREGKGVVGRDTASNTRCPINSGN